MVLKELIAKTVNTHGYENLKEVLGKELGGLLYEVVKAAEKADKELTIVHSCLTKLYENDSCVPQIKKTLDKIEKLR